MAHDPGNDASRPGGGSSRNNITAEAGAAPDRAQNSARARQAQAAAIAPNRPEGTDSQAWSSTIDYEAAKWARVTKDSPCPACAHDSWCCIDATDGTVLCMRAESDEPVRSGGWLHRHDGIRPIPKATPKRERPNVDWSAIHERFRERVNDDQVQQLADRLGVDPIALRELGIGHDGVAYTLPMHDETGAVCGIRRRMPDGGKIAYTGSRNGVFRRQEPDDGMLLVVEGDSDPAAAISIGLDAIGVPGAGQCGDIAAAYCTGRDVVLVADNDDAGRTGAAKLEQRIRAAGTAASVLTIAPPEGHKDLRDWVRAGARAEDVRALVDAARAAAPPAEPAPEEPSDERVDFCDWTDLLQRPPVQWSVRRLLPKASVALLAGDTQAGKSFLAIDLALRLLHGRDFLGQPTQPGSVVYLCGEGQDGFAARLRAWKLQNNPHPSEAVGRYLMVSDAIPRLGKAHMKKLRELVAGFVKVRGHAPELVVIDTLSQGLEGDENDAEVTAPVMRGLAKIRQRFGCSFLIVHHVVKGGKLGRDEWHGITLNDVRGSGALTRNADAVLGVHRARDGQAWELVVLKQKDGARVDPIRFERLVVETGLVDNFGDRETSCVIIPAAAVAANRETDAQRRSRRAHEQRAAVVEALRSLGGTTTSIRAVTMLVPGAPADLQGAFAAAIAGGLITSKKVRGQRIYALSEQGALGAGASIGNSDKCPLAPAPWAGSGERGADGGGESEMPPSAPKRPRSRRKTGGAA